MAAPPQVRPLARPAARWGCRCGLLLGCCCAPGLTSLGGDTGGRSQHRCASQHPGHRISPSLMASGALPSCPRVEVVGLRQRRAVDRPPCSPKDGLTRVIAVCLPLPRHVVGRGRGPLRCGESTWEGWVGGCERSGRRSAARIPRFRCRPHPQQDPAEAAADRCCQSSTAGRSGCRLAGGAASRCCRRRRVTARPPC